MKSSWGDLYSLYIHWPFCSSKCYYCDFVALEQHSDFQEGYHKALIREVELFALHNPCYNKQIATIFIGGGTPSLWPTEYMEEFFATLRKYFDLSNLKEFAMEANPADITEERLDAWDSFGINRLSIGVQVLDDDILLKLNRRQRTRDVLNALKIVPKYFDNFSMDLILGLPNVSDETWFKSVKQVINSPAKHVSIYFLMVHEKTPLYYKVQKGELVLADDDHIIDLYEKTVQMLALNRFEQYEISNFAKPGFESIHNQAYWNQQVYKGFGIGACSYDGKKRYTNEKNLSWYLEKMKKDDYDGLSTYETLSSKQQNIEYIMLNLRQKKGLDLHRMIYSNDDKEKSRFRSTLELLKELALIEEKNSVITLTQRGMALENEVLLKLI